jgi:hypothetical protein
LKVGDFAERHFVMNDEEKLQIRKRATRRFIRTVIGMTLLGALFLWAGYGIRALHRNEQKVVLIQRSRLFFDESMRFWAERGEQLVAYPPPENSAQRPAWAALVDADYGHPVDVFVKSGTQITWVTRPSVAGVADSVEDFAGSRFSPAQHPFRILGMKQIWHRSIHVNAGRQDMWLVNDAVSENGWGVVYDSREDWYGFIKSLNIPYGTAPEFGGPAWMLHGTFDLPPSGSRKYLIGVRAWMNDSLLFESPDLDTTTISYVTDLNDGRRLEYYAPPRDVARITDRVLVRQAWFMALYAILLLWPFYRWYHTVRKLTEADA